ncbi:M48 family metalloprotease [Brunnivagina elsteri]|uniref:Zn-dependent protease with chaperone function n=1 Tax=Brunnivagina elsteri CCALA 953 TaxID=987040 RepID=A0A2A2TBD1_9CYAN|nr:zinc metalloprotease HtpX [Calothrix elsteri]PAX51040.1 Zn-dependent protease with chaperone function [Calothrix elsteri CCALA 953]
MSSDAKPSLDAGLAALKQGDYQTAKTILESFVTTEKNLQAAIQAQIGLVVAYARTGDIPAAMTLSEILAQSNNLQVKQWAERSLEELLKRNRRDIKSRNEQDATGFVAFDDEVVENISRSLSQSSDGNDSDNTPIETEVVNTSFTSLPSSPANSDNDTSNTGKIVRFTTPLAKPLTIHWRQAGRAKNWKSQQQLNLIPLRLLGLGTFIALFWVVRELLVFTFASINNILVWLPFLEPLQLLYTNPTNFLLIILIALTALSPWLLDQLLTKFYGMRYLQQDALDLHSQEAVRLLRRFSQQRGFQFPYLGILPITVPIAIAYGHIPRTTRIVVSQGLLQQLAEDEIAAIYTEQLAHAAHWDGAIMSLVLLVTIPIYWLYQQISKWGNRTKGQFLNFVYIALSSIVYGIWCLITGTSIWLSQVRLYYADRFVCDFTGNPNGLTRALLKISVGIAADIQKQEQTSWQLESLNIAAPIGFQQSITLGSLAPHIAFDSLLMWDYLNPYRYWLTINNTHPLIGDRIQRLLQIARNWRIEPEFDIEAQSPIRVSKQSFYMQIAPFLGIPCGLVFAGIIGIGWQILFALKILNLKWIYDDWDFVTGCIFICCSICLFIRINSFFPELRNSRLQTEENLPKLLDNPAAIPIDQNGVCISGKLIGRPGICNSLGQDLILQTNTALIKLHHISWLGQPQNPQDFIGRKVSVTGWLRRGATPWLDIQSLKTQNGKIINSPHPIWSTIVAIASVTWGAFILLKG